MQIKDVTKKYNGKPVVDAVNLEIPKGKSNFFHWSQRCG